LPELRLVHLFRRMELGGKTIGAAAHERVGMIRYRRGKIEILDVEALRESACECYDAVRTSYNSLLDESGNLSLGEG
jgi:hypothetical protein